MYIRYTALWNFSKLVFVLHILAFTKFQLRWCAPFQLLWTLFKSSFLPLRSLWKSDLKCFQTSRNCGIFFGTFLLMRNFYSGDAHHANYGKYSLNHHFRYCAHCIWDLQCFQTFWNCSLFGTFRLLRNSYSGDTHHANYAKHSLHHHFQHCAHCVYQIHSHLKLFEIAVCFFTFGLLRNFYSGDAHHANYGKYSLNHHFRYCAHCIWDLQCFQTFWNCSLFCTFRLLRNSYSGDAHHANYAKHSLHHHFQHCAHCVYLIYSVLKLFEIAVCFFTFGLLRNFYSGDAYHANYGKYSLNHHYRYCAHCIWDLQCFQTFWNCSLFCTFRLLRNSYSGDAHHANYAKHSLHHHFQHCAHCVYQIYSVLKPFEIAVCFFTFGLLRNFYFGDAPRANHGERCSNHLFWYCANWVNQIYSLLKLFEIGVCFCTFLLLWNFCSGDAHHANYGKHTLNHHFKHSANCVYQI